MNGVATHKGIEIGTRRAGRKWVAYAVLPGEQDRTESPEMRSESLAVTFVCGYIDAHEVMSEGTFRLNPPEVQS